MRLLKEIIHLDQLATWFDLVTLACFLGMAGAFFLLTGRRPRTLVHLLPAAIAFAVANQLGNAGYALFGGILIVIAIGYTVMVIRHE